LGWYSTLQIYAPGGEINPVTQNFSNGLVNVSGTPNLLRDCSYDCYQAQWTDLMQGGLDAAEFDLRLKYEDTTDFVFGNWVVFGCLGASLTSNASSGDSSLIVSNLYNQQALAADRQVKDLNNGDLIIVSDGTNAEMFVVNNITGPSGGHWTVNLSAAWNTVQIEQQTKLVNEVSSGASSVLVYNKTAPNGHVLSNGDSIAIGNDGYTVSSITGPGADGNFTLHLSGTTSQSYSKNTPVSAAGPGATTIFCTTTSGVPSGNQIWMDSGRTFVDARTITGKVLHQGLTLSSGLTNAHGAGAPVLFKMNNTLQNNYAGGFDSHGLAKTRITRVQYQGYLTQRIHSTQILDQFSFKAQGFFARYNSVMDSSTVQNEDAAQQMKRDLASYASTIPGIIVNDTQAGAWLASANTIKVNVQETDSQFTQLIDTILRQENGNSLNVQYAVWVGPDRIVRHLPIATSPAYTKYVTGGHTYSTPTYYLALSDASSGSQNPTFGDTIASIQTTDEDGTSLINAAIVTGTTAPNGSGVYNANTTTLAQTAHVGDTHLVVTSVPSTWPASATGLKLRFKNISGAYPDYINHTGTTVQLSPGLATQLNIGQDVELITHLTSPSSAGDQLFHVGNTVIFSSGQQVTFDPTGTDETLTIQSMNPGAKTITTTTAAKHPHTSAVCLAANGSGQGPRILVEQLDSIYGGVDDNGNRYGGFGWFEGTLSSEDIYDEKRLAEWAAKQLSITAWPLVNCQVQLNNSSARLSGRDLVQIEGFTGVYPNLVQNVSSIQYNATAADANISGTLNLGILHSTVGSVIKDIAKERTHKVKYKMPAHHGNQDCHVHGHAIAQADLQSIAIDAGTVQLNGQTYQIPALTTAVPDGESRWGASCGPGVASPAIVEMPNRLWNGRKVYAHGSTWTIDQAGDAPQQVDTFSGIPLWKVKAVNGGIVGWEPLFQTRGVKLEHLPSSSVPPAPNVTGFSPTLTAAGNGISGDIALSGTVNNFPTDGATAEVKFYVRTNGTTPWHHAKTYRVSGLPQPSISQAITTVLQGVPMGQSIDIGMTFDGFNGEGTATVLASNFTLPNIAPGIPFPGGTLNSDGSWSNVDGITSARSYTVKSNDQIEIQAVINLGNTGGSNTGSLVYGNRTNGYGLEYVASGSGTVVLVKYVGTSRSVLDTLVTGLGGQDTLYHSYKLNVRNLGAFANQIEASWDGFESGVIADTAFSLATVSWGITPYTGGATGTLGNYLVSQTIPLYNDLPSTVQGVILSNGQLAALVVSSGELDVLGKIAVGGGSASFPTITAGSGAPSSSVTPGSIYLRKDTGIGLNAKIYVYDEIAGWEPVSLTGST